MAESKQSRYLQYLPAIFQERPLPDEEPYLGQFLLPFERALTGFDELLSVVDQNFTPALAAPNDFLPWLATWIALLLDKEWDVDKKRRLLSTAVELYRWRGTVNGLKRYLEIYTGLLPDAIDIREACWPAGMQIGIASRIGVSLPKRPDDKKPCTPGLSTIVHDDYVVDTIAPTDLPPAIDPVQQGIVDGQAIQLRYLADKVDCVQIDPDKVCLWYRYEDPADETAPVAARKACHSRSSDGTADPSQPNISRHNERIDYCYSCPQEIGGAYKTTWGGTLLVDEAESPYRFIVDVRGSPDDLARFAAQRATVGDPDEPARAKARAKLLAILNLEKPAHTAFFLRFTPVPTEKTRHWMQIEVHSTIGLDTDIG